MKLVDVPKDLREIEDKVFKNLTKRQVIHLIIATPLLFAIYTTTNIIVDDIFTSSLVSFICVFPLFLNLFYKKEGLTFLEILKLKHFKVISIRFLVGQFGISTLFFVKNCKM